MRMVKIFEHISLDGVIQAPARGLEFVDTKALPSGILINRYKPAGPLERQS